LEGWQNVDVFVYIFVVGGGICPQINYYWWKRPGL